MATIDVNSDLGEWDAAESSAVVSEANDAILFTLITSANVAAGFHAGGQDSMRASARLAAIHDVSLGVHPSYRDREGFGRRDREVAEAKLVADIIEQVQAFALVTASAGTSIRYLKPHGALYNRIVHDNYQADAVARAAWEVELPLLGLSGTAIHHAAERRGVDFYREAFADRAYLPDGSLAPRSLPRAVITNPIEAAERSVRIAVDGKVRAIDGSLISLAVDSLCVHGDNSEAIAVASAVRHSLVDAGLQLRAFV